MLCIIISPFLDIGDYALYKYVHVTYVSNISLKKTIWAIKQEFNWTHMNGVNFFVTTKLLLH